MTIRCTAINKADKTGVQFTILGDGVGTTFKAAINKPPFNLAGITPSIVVVDTLQQGITAQGVINTVLTDTILTLTFSAPIPVIGIGPDVVFQYDSLP